MHTLIARVELTLWLSASVSCAGAGLHVQVQEPGAPQPLARPPHLTSPIINGSVAQGAASLTGVHAMNPTSAPQMTPVQHATMAPAPVGYRPMVSPAPAVMSTGAQAMLEKAANARAVDVCFVVDCTGSMSHWIQQVKDKGHTNTHAARCTPIVLTAHLTSDVLLPLCAPHCDAVAAVWCV